MVFENFDAILCPFFSGQYQPVRLTIMQVPQTVLELHKTI